MRKLPVKAQTLVAMVVVGGAACLALRVPDVAWWSLGDLMVFAILSAGIVLSEQIQVPLRFGREAINFSLTEALWVGVLLHSRSSVVTMAVAAGVLVGHVIRRRAPHKVAFNTGQFLLALTAAEVVLGSLRSADLLGPMTFLAVALGMAAYAAINAGLVAVVVSLVQGKRLRSVLLPPLPENALHFAVNTALGLAAAVMWRSAPGTTPLLLLPLVMSFVAYRTLLATVGRSKLIAEVVRLAA